MAAAAAQSRQQLEEGLVKRAEAEVERMMSDATSGNPDAVERKSKRVAEIVKDKAFPIARRRELQDRCTSLLRQAYETSVNLYLDDAVAAGRGADDARMHKLLAKAKDHFTLALRAGASEDFKEAVRRKLELIGLTGPLGTSEKTNRAAAEEAAKPQPPSTASGGVGASATMTP
ncbi:MAG: hypothetical protein HYR63_13465 [Proteobacteria bacterium]|nr:hypothetical protein [Pseudomonadota bacterium]MBI3496894.1 hypothetical protein [Pseudomonadota bacterium]